MPSENAVPIWLAGAQFERVRAVTGVVSLAAPLPADRVERRFGRALAREPRPADDRPAPRFRRQTYSGGSSTVVWLPVVRNRNAARSCSTSLDSQVCNQTRSTIVDEGESDRPARRISGRKGSGLSATKTCVEFEVLFFVRRVDRLPRGVFRCRIEHAPPGSRSARMSTRSGADCHRRNARAGSAIPCPSRQLGQRNAVANPQSKTCRFAVVAALREAAASLIATMPDSHHSPDSCGAACPALPVVASPSGGGRRSRISIPPPRMQARCGTSKASSVTGSNRTV